MGTVIKFRCGEGMVAGELMHPYDAQRDRDDARSE
jgi:hypothetical protein